MATLKENIVAYNVKKAAELAALKAEVDVLQKKSDAGTATPAESDALFHKKNKLGYDSLLHPVPVDLDLADLKSNIRDLQLKKDLNTASVAELNTLADLKEKLVAFEAVPPFVPQPTSIAAQIAGLQAEANALKANIVPAVNGLHERIRLMHQHLSKVRETDPISPADALALKALKLTLASIIPNETRS